MTEQEKKPLKLSPQQTAKVFLQIVSIARYLYPASEEWPEERTLNGPDDLSREFNLYMDIMPYVDKAIDEIPTLDLPAFKAEAQILCYALKAARADGMQIPQLTVETGYIISSIELKEIFSQIVPQFRQFQPDKASLFLNIPSSSFTDLINQALSSGRNMEELASRKSAFNHSTKIKVGKPKNEEKKRIINQKNKSGEITVMFDDIDKLQSSNSPAKKLFSFALSKLNEQAASNGHITRPSISFPLEELVELGIYKSTRTARAGFTTAANVLTSMKVSGTIKKGKSDFVQKEIAVLFPYAGIKNSCCTLDLNDRINWAIFFQFYMPLPKYSFRLPSRAYDLLFYIFYLARQNCRKIQQDGCFNISFRAIQSRLQLPNEWDTEHPQRDIKDEIDNAITAIEEASDTEDFQLTPIYDETASISEYLDAGYLEIRMKGVYASTFIELAKTTTKAIEARKRRQQAIEDRVKEKALLNAQKAGTQADNSDKKS